MDPEGKTATVNQTIYKISCSKMTVITIAIRKRMDLLKTGWRRVSAALRAALTCLQVT